MPVIVRPMNENAMKLEPANDNHQVIMFTE